MSFYLFKITMKTQLYQDLIPMFYQNFMLIVNHECMLLQVLAALILLTWCIFSSSFPHPYLPLLDDLWSSENVLHCSNLQPANGVVDSAHNLWAPIPQYPWPLGYYLHLPLPKLLKKSTLCALQQFAVPHVAERDVMCTATYIDNQELCTLTFHVALYKIGMTCGINKFDYVDESHDMNIRMMIEEGIAITCQWRLIQRWTWHLSFGQLSWRSRECNTVTIENSFEYGSLN